MIILVLFEANIRFSIRCSMLTVSACRDGATRKGILPVRFANRFASLWIKLMPIIVCMFNTRNQVFKPGYTAPPPLFTYGGIPMNFRYHFTRRFRYCFAVDVMFGPIFLSIDYPRGNWEISRRDLQNLQFISTDSTSDNFLDSDGDEFPVSTPRSVLYCRIIAIIVFPSHIAF